MIRRLFSRLRLDQRGLVFVETAIAVSVLSFITMAGVEIGRYVLLAQKLDRVASAMADLTSQGATISVGDLNNLFAAAGEIVKPFSLSTVGTVIVSSISRAVGQPARVDWQRSGAGALSVASKIGIAGGPAVLTALPAGFVVREGEEVIVAEVYYSFTPWLAPDVFKFKPGQLSAMLYHRAFFRPRTEPLSTLLP